MTTSVSQSAIGELRDQLCLDFADGKYLNVVSSNLGIQRPPFGFDDDTWRALVKVISLQYKQVKTKFEDILTILLGPKVTQCSSFANSVLSGAKHAVLVGTKQFPQVGTMVIDEGLPTEETVRYSYIDRYTNTVYFDTPLVFNHPAVNAEWETGVIGPTDALEVTRTVCDTSGFPDPTAVGTTYPVVVGRGTQYEYVDEFQSAASAPARFISLTNGAPIAHPGLNSSLGAYALLAATASQSNAYYLNMDSVSTLPLEKGILSGDVSGALTATGGTTTTVVTAGPLPTTSPYSGFTIRFNGNVTAALAGRVGYVASNNTTTFFLFNTLPASPVAGDTFVLIANFEYIRAQESDNSVLMKQELPNLQVFAANTKFSVLIPSTTVCIAQVQVKSGGWDVIQSDADHVEILLPTDALENDLRSASYIRAAGAGSSTANAPFYPGGTDTSVVSTSSFALVGVLEHTPGNIRYTYYNPHAWISTEAAAGATSIKVNSTALFPSTGTLRIDGVTLVSYTVVDAFTLGVSALPSAVVRGMLVREENILKLARPLTSPILFGDTLSFYANYMSGDTWSVADVWAGPYVWDLYSHVHKQQTVAANSATTYLSGPTNLSVDRLAGSSVLELEDGSAFPLATPYNILVGENSGNRETLAVQQVSLKSRTYTTVNTAVLPVGSTSIPVASLSGPLAPANAFPNAGTYRVAIWTSPTVVEVVEVISTGPGLVLNLAFGTTAPHALGDRIVLLSDLVRVAPSTGDDHLGIIAAADRLAFYAPETQSTSADTVRPLYTSVSLSLAGTDFSVDGGTAVANFGNAVGAARSATSALTAIAATVIQCSDTSDFPTTGYPYIVRLGKGLGPLYEELVHVTNNNTGLNQLTISHGTKWSYPTGTAVEFTPGQEENFSYTSKSGNTLSTSPYLLVNNTHQSAEFIAPTVGTNYPRINGFDFPLRLPITIEDRIKFVIDLVRAAGVLVTFISKR
jgi:hypothetical protein